MAMTMAMQSKSGSVDRDGGSSGSGNRGGSGIAVYRKTVAKAELVKVK